MKDRVYIALDPSMSSDDVDRASWDLNWSFMGTIEKDSEGPQEKPQQRSREAKPFVLYDEEIDQTFSLSRNVFNLEKRVSDNSKEDQYETTFADTIVTMVHDDDMMVRYLVVSGPHHKEVSDEASALLHTITTEEAEHRFNSATKDADRISSLFIYAIAGGDDVRAQIKHVSTEDSSEAVRSAARKILQTVAVRP